MSTVIVEENNPEDKLNLLDIPVYMIGAGVVATTFVAKGAVAVSKKVYKETYSKLEEISKKQLSENLEKLKTAANSAKATSQGKNFQNLVIDFYEKEKESISKVIGLLNKEKDDREKIEKVKEYRNILSKEIEKEINKLKDLYNNLKKEKELINNNKTVSEIDVNTFAIIKEVNPFIFDYLLKLLKNNKKNIKYHPAWKVAEFIRDSIEQNNLNNIIDINASFLAFVNNPLFLYIKENEELELIRKLQEALNKKNKGILDKYIGQLKETFYLRDRKKRFEEAKEKAKNVLEEKEYRNIKVITKRKYVYVKGEKDNKKAIIRLLKENIEPENNEIIWIDVKGRNLDKKTKKEECKAISETLLEYGIQGELKDITTDEDLEKVADRIKEKNKTIKLTIEDGMTLEISGKTFSILEETAEKLAKGDKETTNEFLNNLFKVVSTSKQREKLKEREK